MRVVGDRMLILVLLWVTLLGYPGTNPVRAQSTATLEGLDLSRIEVRVLAPVAVRERLLSRVQALFARAGLPLGAARAGVPDKPPAPMLSITINPQLLHEPCRDKALYIKKLELFDLVLIPRNRVVLSDSVWWTGPGYSVRGPIPFSQMESDVEDLVGRFISAYRRANPGTTFESAGQEPEALYQEAQAEFPPRSESLTAGGDAGLAHLSLEALRVSVMAGRVSDRLTGRAIRQLTEAGVPVPSRPRGDAPVTLGAEFIQQSVAAHCPGQVLYEAGLYLVEEVQLERNPQVRIWSDTWARNSVQVVPPRAVHEIEADQDALLAQFVRGLQAR